MFGKRHDHVLRDINALDISSELRRSWFRPATGVAQSTNDQMRDINALEISPDLGRSWFQPTIVHDSCGREQPAVDLTRNGRMFRADFAEPAIPQIWGMENDVDVPQAETRGNMAWRLSIRELAARLVPK